MLLIFPLLLVIVLSRLSSSDVNIPSMLLAITPEVRWARSGPQQGRSKPPRFDPATGVVFQRLESADTKL